MIENNSKRKIFFLCKECNYSVRCLKRHCRTKKHVKNESRFRQRTRELSNDIQWRIIDFLFDKFSTTTRRNADDFYKNIHSLTMRPVLTSIYVRHVFRDRRSHTASFCTRCNFNRREISCNMTYEGFIARWQCHGFCMNCLYQVSRSTNWLTTVSNNTLPVVFPICIDRVSRRIFHTYAFAPESAVEVYPSNRVLKTYNLFFDDVVTNCLRRNVPMLLDLSESWDTVLCVSFRTFFRHIKNEVDRLNETLNLYV